MSEKMPSREVPRFESMTFGEIESDPEYGSTLQKNALEVLRTKDKEWFERKFTGELDENGYLIEKDGSPAKTKPSMNMSGGPVMEETLEKTKAELRSK